MPVMRMTVPCIIYKYIGSDIYGSAQYDTSHPIKTRCSLVDIKDDDNRTTVRTDSSATAGNAFEETFDCRLLIPKTVTIGLQDRVVVTGYNMKVMRISPRRNVVGQLDHIEIRCNHATMESGNG